MNSNVALSLVRAWERAENVGSASALRPEENGSLIGRVASIGFQYDPDLGTLIVRAAATRLAGYLAGMDDIRQELDRIAREEPRRVEHARFELWKAPWDKEEPSLYLRREYQDDGLVPAAAVAQWRKLRETAYLWMRFRYREAIDPVVKRRR